MNKILTWEMIGIAAISIAGALLHFVFEWTGYWDPAAIIAGVNESTWEHLKIAFWPMLAYGVIEYFILGKKRPHNFLVAKAVALLVVPILIIFFFYTYTFFTGEDILFIDILTFVLAIAVGQVVSYLIIKNRYQNKILSVLSVVVILIGVVLFSLLSYYPYENFLFLDPVTDGYGIVEDHHHE
ncbi:DUF6512 family protein [Patescibacteria group bacterium]